MISWNQVKEPRWGLEYKTLVETSIPAESCRLRFQCVSKRDKLMLSHTPVDALKYIYCPSLELKLTHGDQFPHLSPWWKSCQVYGKVTYYGGKSCMSKDSVRRIAKNRCILLPSLSQRLSCVEAITNMPDIDSVQWLTHHSIVTIFCRICLATRYPQLNHLTPNH